MKALKTKVILSAFVLLFALVATIGSTYAWFTVSNTVTVNPLTITVQSQEALLIRPWNSGQTEVADQVYSSYLYGPASAPWQLTDFASTFTLDSNSMSTYYNNYSTWLLAPVTALAGETSGDTDYDLIDVLALRTLDISDPTERVLSAADANTTSGDYIELKFWLIRTSTDGVDKDVALNFGATGTYANALHVAVVGNYETTSADMVFAVEAGDDSITSPLADFGNYNVGDSIVISGSGSNNSTVTVTSVTSDGAGSTADVITVSETLIAETAGATVTLDLAKKTTIFSTGRDYTFAFSASDAGFNDTTAILNSVIVANRAALTALYAGSTGSTPVTYLQTANVPELVTVRIWVEGWDADTTNAIMASSFSLSLGFELV